MTQHHETEPENYAGKLSEEASRQRKEVEDELQKLYQKLSDEKNPLRKTKLANQIELVERNLEYHGANPKKLDFAELRDYIRMPHYSLSKPEVEARARIRNRTTAIRAMCLHCMCGDSALVRLCASLTCPLHPFRLGKDPLRGYEPPEAEEIEIELEEGEIDEFEDEDD